MGDIKGGPKRLQPLKAEPETDRPPPPPPPPRDPHPHHRGHQVQHRHPGDTYRRRGQGSGRFQGQLGLVWLLHSIMRKKILAD